MRNRLRSWHLITMFVTVLLFGSFFFSNASASRTIFNVLYRFSTPFVGDTEIHPYAEWVDTDHYRTYIEKITDSGSLTATADTSFVEGKKYDAYVVFEVKDIKNTVFDDDVGLMLLKEDGSYTEHPLVSKSTRKVVTKIEFTPVTPVEISELNIKVGKVIPDGMQFGFIVDNPYIVYNKMPVMQASFDSKVKGITDAKGKVDLLKAEKYAVMDLLENDKDYTAFFGLKLKDGFKYSPDCKVKINGVPMKIISMSDRDGYAVYNFHYKDGHKIVSKDVKFILDGITYHKYADSDNLTVIKGKNAKKVVIPDYLKLNGKKYKVVFIGMESFKNMKKIRSLTIGKNVKWISAKAFTGCKRLEYINIKTKNLGDITVASDAFAGMAKNVKVKVPKKKYKSYKSLLDGTFGKSKVVFTK